MVPRSTLCCVEVTISIDDELLARLREEAERRGVPLDDVIREQLGKLERRMTPDEVVRELHRQWDESTATLGEKRWTRDELYDRDVLR